MSVACELRTALGTCDPTLPAARGIVGPEPVTGFRHDRGIHERDLGSLSRFLDRNSGVRSRFVVSVLGHAGAMRIVLIIAGVVVFAVALAAVLVRRLDHDADVWHVDPLTAPTPSTPNSYRVAPADAAIDADSVSPIFPRPVDEVAAAFDRIAIGAGNVEVVAGSADDGFVTYVQSSTLFGFPDYISVRFIEVDATTSTLSVFSRSRLGQSDLGVNKKRVTSWLDQLAATAN